MSDETDAIRAADERFERAVFWRSIAIALFVAGVIVARALLG
jgi:hypothetical protein